MPSTRKISAAQVRESLIKQLEIKGADVELYRSLIEDYMWFWKQEREMQKDIKERGRTYEATSSTGKLYEKNNQSVKDALLYSRQMVAILSALGLETDTVVSGNPGGDADADL